MSTERERKLARAEQILAGSAKCYACDGTGVRWQQLSPAHTRRTRCEPCKGSGIVGEEARRLRAIIEEVDAQMRRGLRGFI